MTKSGHVFLFDRETGAPLFPIEERPVPPSDLKGEGLADAAVAGQAPALLAPAVHRGRSHRHLPGVARGGTGAVPQDAARAASSCLRAPQGTVIFPGFDGGAEWGGAAFDAAPGFCT